MPIETSGLEELIRDLRRFNKRDIVSAAKSAIGGPSNVILPPFRFPPTQGEHPRAEQMVERFADLVMRKLGKR